MDATIETNEETVGYPDGDQEPTPLDEDGVPDSWFKAFLNWVLSPFGENWG